MGCSRPLRSFARAGSPTTRSRAAGDRGTLHRIHPGVYSVNAPPLSMHARFLAATKATNGVLSHYSAATLWRLVDYDENTAGPRHGHHKPHAQSPRRHRPPHPPRPADHPPGLHPRHHPGTRLDRPLLDAVVHPTPPRCPRGLRAETSDARRTTRPDQKPRRGSRPGLRPHRIRTRGRHPRPDPRLLRATPGPTHPDPRRHPHPPRLPLARPQPHRSKPTAPSSTTRLIARQDDAAKQARLEAHGDRVVRVTWDQVMTQPDQTVTRIRMAGAPRRAG